MKKIFTILFAGLLTFSLSAQRDAGTWYMEGSTAVDWNTQAATSTTYDGDNVDLTGDGSDDNILGWGSSSKAASKLELKGLSGYFVADGLMVGLSLKQSSAAAVNLNDDVTNTTEFAMGPAIRWYIANSGGFIHAAYLFGSGNEKFDGEQVDGAQYSSSALAFGGGYALALNDYVSLPMSLTYSLNGRKYKETDTLVERKYSYGNFGLHIGIAVALY